MSGGRQIYFNDVQRRVQLVGANTSVILAGRRTGKTDSIASPFVYRNMQRMAGSTGAIVVPTYKHGLTNTIPGMLAAWRRWGLIENTHFCVGKRPPKHFGAPITPRHDFEHIITLYNGSQAVIVSQDRPGSANSLTLDWLLVDEAKFINYEKLKDEVLPANGGMKVHFGHHSFHHSMMVLSDMPQTKRGSWMMTYADKARPDLIEAIEGGVYEIWRMKQMVRDDIAAGRAPREYLRDRIRRLDRAVNRLRATAVYYKEYSSVENLQLIGEKYLRQMKRDLTPLTFQTSIMCRRIGVSRDGFYSSMKEHHKYDASDFAYLDAFALGSAVDADTARADADVDPDAPLRIGMDYNANINWMVVGQPDGRKLKVVKSFYVKYDRKLPQLVDDFCRYYATHRCKTVVFYYDSTALGSNYAVNDQDFQWVISNEFERHGWTVERVYLGQPMRHDEKYLLINQGFAGKQRLMPMFNRQNNDDLLLAIQAAGVSRGRLGFRKDKAGEKLAESEEDRLEHRTDGTDAFDTLYIGCEKFPYDGPSGVFASGIL